MKITFPNLTAKEIVEECKNVLGSGKLLWSTWMEDEDFFTKEKCRPRTVEVTDEIQCLDRNWNQCSEYVNANRGGMLNFAEAIWFLKTYYEKTGKYFDDRWFWTSSRSSRGYLVRVGKCASGGIRVGYGGPGGSDSDLGVVFSRSAAILGAEAGQAEAGVGDLEAAIAKVKAEGYVIYKPV